eukprot:Tbor_TRINITY_DN2436_c0_g1::TRINITY_DN2436_c0_g1_i1::g.2570::m.2570/K18463/CCDC53; WASH complex subunit CCDC53
MSASTALMAAKKAAEFQRTTELINKYTISTLQFINRFSATCEMKILSVNRQLERLEAQVILLEYKLDSIDGGRNSREKDNATGAGIGAPPAMQLTAPAMFTGSSAPTPPPMAGFGSSGAVPPPPGSKMPPLPPGVVAPSTMPPPGAPPPGFVPPLPPPQMANGPGKYTIRQHPRLQGYYQMQEAGVPIVAIKMKMQVDGHNPEWFDTPDAPAPSAVKPPLCEKNFYDSD